MLNQIQTGKFIAEIRKSKNMTQKELAEKLGMSDKTVSKWETGKGMPDVSIMGSLCEILEINVNELLSGEKLSTESYNGKAEENMMNLIKKSEEEKRKHGWEKGSSIIGLLLMAASFVWVMMGSPSEKRMHWFMDAPCVFILFVIICMISIASGTIGDLFRAFSICYGNKEYPSQEVIKSLNAVQFFIKGIFLSGVFVTLVSFIATMRMNEPAETFGIFIAISMIPMLYCVILDILLLPIESKLKNRIPEAKR